MVPGGGGVEQEITGEPVGAGVEGVGGEFAAAFAIAFDKLRDRAVELGAIEIGRCEAGTPLVDEDLGERLLREKPGEIRAGPTRATLENGDRRAEADVVARHGRNRDRCRGVGSGGRIKRNLGDTASDGVGSDRWRAVDLRDRCGLALNCARSARGRHVIDCDGRRDQRRCSRAVTTRSSEDRRHHDGGRKPTFHQS